MYLFIVKTVRRQHALAVCFLPYSRLKTFWTCVWSQLGVNKFYWVLVFWVLELLFGWGSVVYFQLQTSSFPSSQQLPVLVTAQTPGSSPASSSSITEAQSQSGRTKPVQIGTFQFHVRLSASLLARCSSPPRTNKTVLTWEHSLVLIITWWTVSVRKPCRSTIWARNVKSCQTRRVFIYLSSLNLTPEPRLPYPKRKRKTINLGGRSICLVLRKILTYFCGDAAGRPVGRYRIRCWSLTCRQVDFDAFLGWSWSVKAAAEGQNVQRSSMWHHNGPIYRTVSFW